MSETERLEAELELSKLTDALETAREAMHADRSNAKALQAYKDASTAVANARTAFRERFRVELGPGDAAPIVDTVNVETGVDQ